MMIKWLVLLFVSWLAATISGVAGFGGSLIILPVFSHIIDVKKAIPILTVAWLMGNASRAMFGYKEIQWRPVIYFCVGAVPRKSRIARTKVALIPRIFLSV